MTPEETNAIKAFIALMAISLLIAIGIGCFLALLLFFIPI